MKEASGAHNGGFSSASRSGALSERPSPCFEGSSGSKLDSSAPVSSSEVTPFGFDPDEDARELSACLASAASGECSYRSRFRFLKPRCEAERSLSDLRPERGCLALLTGREKYGADDMAPDSFQCHSCTYQGYLGEPPQRCDSAIAGSNPAMQSCISRP